MSTTSPEFHFTILSQLLQIVTSNAVGRTEFSLRIDPEDPAAGSMQEQLLAGVLDGTIRSDEEAALKLYSAGPSDQRYMTLRSRCIDRLLNEVRHIDLTYNQLSEYSSNHFKCVDLYRVGKMLALYGNSLVARYTFSRALSIARRYEFTMLEYMIRTELGGHALVAADAVANRESHSAKNKLLVSLCYENLVESAYDTLFVLNEPFDYAPISFAESRTIHQDSALSLMSSVDEQFRTYSFNLNHARVSIDYALAQCDYESALRKIDDFLQYYSDNPHLKQNSRIGELILNRLEAQICSRSITPSSNVYNPADHFHTGKTNWCLANALSSYIYLYNGDYQSAFATFLQLRSRFSETIVALGAYEHRMLLEAYLWILTKILPASEFGHPDPSSLFSFRESTFLNSMSLLTESKKGTNALVVIAHAFILLIQNKEREAFRRISYLNVYATRYFKGETEQRLWHCVKAMQKIPTFRTRPHMMRDAMAPAIDRIRRLSDLPMKHGFNELVQWDVLLEAYIAWEIERVSRQRQ